LGAGNATVMLDPVRAFSRGTSFAFLDATTGRLNRQNAGAVAAEVTRPHVRDLLPKESMNDAGRIEHRAHYSVRRVDAVHYGALTRRGTSSWSIKTRDGAAGCPQESVAHIRRVDPIAGACPLALNPNTSVP
jgi:hypothetical protein